MPRARGSVPGLGDLKETKMFLPHPRVKVSIVGSLRDRDVACSASDRQGSNFESCVWTGQCHLNHLTILRRFCWPSLAYMCTKPDSFHLDVHKLSPLQKTEIGTAIIHHIHGKLSWSSLVIIYMCKKVSEYPSHLFTHYPYSPPPPPV